MQPRAKRRPFILRLIFSIPIIGWMLRDLMEGREDAVFWFIFNVAVLVGFAIAIWGYAALILIALSAAAVSLTAVVFLTRG